MPLLKGLGMSLTLSKEVTGVSVPPVSRDTLETKDVDVSCVEFCEALADLLCGRVAGDASASENTDNLFLFLGEGEFAEVSARAATASCTESSDQRSNSSLFVEDFRRVGLGPKKRLVDASSAGLVEAVAMPSEQRRCLLGGLAHFGSCALVTRRASWGAECGGAGMLATLRIAGGRMPEGCDAEYDEPDCTSSSRR